MNPSTDTGGWVQKCLHSQVITELNTSIKLSTVYFYKNLWFILKQLVIFFMFHNLISELTYK